jgi:hypothetical protein
MVLSVSHFLGGLNGETSAKVAERMDVGLNSFGVYLRIQAWNFRE